MMLYSVFLFLNLGGGEIFIVVLVVIMLFGSDKLPGIAKTLGKGIREINDAKQQIQNEIQKNTGGLQAEIEKHTSAMKSEIQKATTQMENQVSDVTKTIREEGKTITDTTKE